MKTFAYTLLFASALALATACSDKKPAATAEGDAAAASTVETDAVTLLGDWDILQVDTISVPQTEDTPYLTFNLHTLTLGGMTGCNRIMGKIVLGSAASDLKFENVASTRMMCPDDGLEQQILNAVNATASYTVIPTPKDVAPKIALFDASGKQLLILEREPLTDTVLDTTPEEN